jgi:hypothetical protein
VGARVTGVLLLSGQPKAKSALVVIVGPEIRHPEAREPRPMPKPFRVNEFHDMGKDQTHDYSEGGGVSASVICVVRASCN